MTRFLYSSFMFLFSLILISQEGITPLSGNLNYVYKDLSLTPENKVELNQHRPGSLLIPFRDDFYYACTAQYASKSLWRSDSSVYVNTGYPVAPPSIGVATFDGLNKHGYPYLPTLQNLGLSFPADTLCSNPINLFTTATSQTLLPTDKIALSFYYQARGFGEPPEQNDSLILDLYKPRQDSWNSRVWFTKGSSNPNLNDTTFKRVFVWLKDTAYLHDGFKFQFRNSATGAGDFDHYHLDYVYLNQGRDSISDTIYDDLTFGHIPTPFLKDYSAMPYQQYDPSEMAINNWVQLKNNYYQARNFYYEHKIYKESTGLQQYAYSAASSNIPPFKYNGYYNNPPFSNPVSQPTFTYKFPLMTDSTDFKIKHYLYRSGTTTDFFIENDTVIQRHKFRNYYAYDDGSAEGGYYVTGVNAKVALKFRVNKPDTLRAVRIYFDPAPLGSTEKYYFKIKIWYDGLGTPGVELAKKDTAYYPIFYKHGYKEVPEYVLPMPLPLDRGTYYIGFQQQVSTGLVVGFDKNYDSHTNLFYDSGSGWTPSSIRGSLMLHPVFGSLIPHPMSVGENSIRIHPFYSVYPNPSNEKFAIRSLKQSNASFELINELGQIVLQGPIQSLDFEIETHSIHSGMYVLIVKENGLPVEQQKIIIQK
ncbi:MAG: T9SS type A sorting domain-containing protein [bacterium]|nr:T9SS type A sorting domain-containing protein [bacterium]